MATAKLPLESIIGAFKHTLCNKIDLNRVGSRLIEEGKISKNLAKYVRKALRKEDKNLFFSVLMKFDLKSFVVFLEILDTINDRPHQDILKLLCRDLQQHLSLKSMTDQDVVARLQSIVVKYCPSTLAEGAIESEDKSKVGGGTVLSEQTGEVTTFDIEEVQSLTIKTPIATPQGLTTTLHREGQAMLQEPFSTAQSEGSTPVHTIPSASLEGRGTMTIPSVLPTLSQSEGSASQDVAVTGDTGIVLYYKHPVEKFSFSRTKRNVFHSTIHDVTVTVEPEAFPKRLDEFDLFLTVNDYSKPITMSSKYGGVFSALIGLKCEPCFDKFEHHVTVTLPHCAVENFDSLCILSAADGHSHLEDDPDVKIHSFDDNYITFTTAHFTVFRVARSWHSHNRRSTARALSLGSGKQSPGQTAVKRHYSCPTPGDGRTTAIRFCAAMFRPHDTSNLLHWQFIVIFTYDLPTFSMVSVTCVSIEESCRKYKGGPPGKCLM